MSQPPTGCAYDVPAGWVHLDLDPARRSASVRRAVAERARREPRLRPQVARLDRALRTEAELAAAAGAQRVSLLAEPVGGRAVTAALTLSVERLGAGGVSAASVLAGLQAEHARARASDPVAELALVPLPASPSGPPQAAVRRRWREPTTTPTATVPELNWQLIVPWPGRPALALLTLTSVCQPIWPLLEATFDQCLASFRWKGGATDPH